MFTFSKQNACAVACFSIFILFFEVCFLFLAKLKNIFSRFFTLILFFLNQVFYLIQSSNFFITFSFLGTFGSRFLTLIHFFKPSFLVNLVFYINCKLYQYQLQTMRISELKTSYKCSRIFCDIDRPSIRHIRAPVLRQFPS